MRTHYWLTGVLATVLATAASAAPSLPPVKVAAVNEVSLSAPAVRVARVRQASVTTVAQSTAMGLSAATQQVEDYFNSVISAMADFTQSVTGERTQSSGVFYWSKPGKFLWQYEKPVKQKLVSTGSSVYFIDDRGQVTQLPLNAGMARLFNAKTLNMSKQGLRATGVQTTSGQLAVTFAVDKKIAAGDQTGLVSLKLVFERLAGGKLKLAQIDALDTMSVTTRVVFGNLRENVPLPSKMFTFTPGVYEQRN